MEEILLNANTTREVGSSSSRRVRKEGIVPGVLYGLNEESVSLSVAWPDLRRALTTDSGINAIIQLEVDADFEDINTSLLFSFKAISLIANLANKEFNRGILILHSKPNNLPVIAETAITCAQQFFIYEKMGEKKWRKDCLSIKHN